MNIKDHFLTKESFLVKEDEEINGYLKTDIQGVLNNDLGRYYDSKEYLSHKKEADTFFSKIYAFAKRLNLYYKYKAIGGYLPRQSTVLDYGCGTGDFLSYIKEKKHIVKGLELNSDAALVASEKISEEVLHTDKIVDERDGSFGAIMLWHVLEHVLDPQAELAVFKKKLQDKGKLIIALPNHESYDAQFYGVHWAAWDVPRHLHHFSRNAAIAFFEKNGFEVIEIKPLYLDSFYVSILSEKYRQSGLIRVVTAILVGLFSNIKASFNGNYSSLIYVLNKKSIN